MSHVAAPAESRDSGWSPVRHDGVVESTGRDRRAALDHIASELSESALGLTETIYEVASRFETDPVPPGRVGRFAWLGATVRGAVDMGRAARDRGKAFLGVVPLYADATGFEEARARSDMLFVQDRLVVCAQGNDPDRGLVTRVARRLVHWVAEGRPVDPQLAVAEARYATLMEFNKGRPRAWKSSRSAALEEAYREAWRDALESGTPD